MTVKLSKKEHNQKQLLVYWKIKFKMELVELHEVEETFSVNEICKRIKNLEEAVEKLKENNQSSEFKESANQDFKTIPVEEVRFKYFFMIYF